MRTRDKLAPAFDETSQFTDMSRPPRPLLDTVKVGVGEVKTVPSCQVMAREEIGALADHERARTPAPFERALLRHQLYAALGFPNDRVCPPGDWIFEPGLARTTYRQAG